MPSEGPCSSGPGATPDSDTATDCPLGESSGCCPGPSNRDSRPFAAATHPFDVDVADSVTYASRGAVAEGVRSGADSATPARNATAPRAATGTRAGVASLVPAARTGAASLAPTAATPVVVDRNPAILASVARVVIAARGTARQPPLCLTVM